MLALLLLAAGSSVYLHSEARLERVYEVEVQLPERGLAAGPDAIRRGRHLATVVAQCDFCHGADLGGRLLADDPWIGRLDAPNLTAGRGGIGGEFDARDWIRAIRYGLARDGRSLALMPAEHLSRMSDSDLASLIAYLETVPPVDREGPPRRVGWLTRIVLSLGAAPGLISAETVDRSMRAPAHVEPAATEGYGSYLVELGSCRVCHHPDLSGGLHPLSLPGEPPPGDLRVGGPLDTWSEADFFRTMREGWTPEGRPLDPVAMPWPAFAKMSDLELTAIWRSLRAAPGVRSESAEGTIARR